MVNLEGENIKNTTDKAIGMLVDGIELYSPTVFNESIYFGEISSIDILNEGIGYDVTTPPNIEIFDVQGYGEGAKVYGNMKGTLTDILVLSPGVGYDKKPNLNLIGGNFTGGVELETNLIKKVITSSFIPNSIGVAQTTITFINTHNFATGEEVIYNANSFPPIAGLGADSSYFVRVLNPYKVSLYNKKSDALSSINVISDLGTAIGINTGVQEFSTRIPKNVIDKVYIKNFDGNLYNKIVQLSARLYNKESTLNGINTTEDYIYAKNHNLNEKDLIVYNSTGSIISGLTTTSQYYVTVIDKDRFKLSDAGSNNVPNDENYKNKLYSALNSIGAGNHIFKYPPIEITISSLQGTNSTISPILKPIVLGTFESIFIENNGVGYGVSEVVNLHVHPDIRLLDSRQISYDFTTDATLQPIIIEGKIVSVQILNAGNNYQENVDIIIEGEGKYAKLYPNVVDNKIKSVTILNTGIGYKAGKTRLSIVRKGNNAKFLCNVTKWTIDQYYKNKSIIDISPGNGYVIPSRNVKNSLQFINLFPSRSLRNSIKDLANTPPLSPILGWAYDGNPILSPYIMSNSSLLSIVKSGYKAKNTVGEYSATRKRPPSRLFPSGYFVEDYEYVPGTSELDEHNGMYVTDRPDFPKGTYAYYMTVSNTNDATQIPVYPYVIGPSFKNEPSEQNYNVNQNMDFSEKSYIKNTNPLYLTSLTSGYEYLSELQEKYKQEVIVNNVIGSKIDDIKVLNPGKNYKVNDRLVFSIDNPQDIVPKAQVSRLKGKPISNVEVGITTFLNVSFKNVNDIIIGITSIPHNIKDKDYVFISNNTELKLEGSKRVQVQNKNSILNSDLNNSENISYLKLNDISDFNVDDYIKIDNEVAKIIEIYPQNSEFLIDRIGPIGLHTSGVSKVKLLPTKFSFTSLDINSPLSIDNKKYFISKTSIGLGTNGSSIVNDHINTSYYIPPNSIYIPNHGFKTNEILNYFAGPNVNGLLVSSNPVSNTPTRLVSGQQLYAINFGRDYVGISTVGFGATALFFRESEYLIDEYHYFKSTDELTIGKVELSNLSILTEDSHELLNSDNVNIIGISTGWEYYITKFDLNETYKIKLISNKLFDINLKSKPQFIKYAEDNSLNIISLKPENLLYTTNSLNAKGGISDVKILFSSELYKKIPVVEYVESIEGTNANLLAYSNKIGKIDSIERIKDGFDYPSDITLQPKISTNTICYIDNISKVSKVNVLFGGAGYNTPPNLKIMGEDNILLKAQLKNSSVNLVSIEYNVDNLSIPLDVIPINNSNGFDILSITEETINSTYIIELDTNRFPLIYRDYAEPIIDFPFSVGDFIFIENCRILENDKNNYNSLDLNELYFKVISVNPVLGQVIYTISNTIGLKYDSFGTYDILNGYGTVVNKKRLARFQMELEKNDYVSNENVTVLDNDDNITFSGTVMEINGWNKKRSQLRLTKTKGVINPDDSLIGLISRLKGKVLYSNAFTMKATLGPTRDKINYTNKNLEDLNSDLKKLQDSEYYQDFSYTIVGKTPYQIWEEPVKSIIHPSGFKEFSNLQIISKAPNNLITKTTNPSLDFKVEIENENSFFTKNNFTIGYDDEKINSYTTERIYFGSKDQLWPVAGYGNTYINGIELLPYLVNNSNTVIPIKDISSEFTGTYDKISLGNYNVTFDYMAPYYLGISTIGLKVGDIVGYSTYHEYPYDTKILSIGINSIRTLYPHKLYSGITTESLDIVRILDQNNLIGISSFILKARDGSSIYKLLGISTNVNIETDTIELNHKFETGQIIYYENIGGQPIGIGTTTSVIGGISTNILPSTLYVVKIAENKFQVSGSSDLLKLNLTNSGSGTHKFTFDSPNSSSLITIDNIIQTPIRPRGLSINLAEDVGIGNTIIYVSSGISSITSIDTLKIEDEYIKVISVGIGSTNAINVERGVLGSIETSHIGILTAYTYRGNYIINEDVIYFTSPPFGPSGVPGIEVSSSFSGRVFSRTFSPSRPNDKNIILDDISDQFIGDSVFTIKENGNTVVGLYTNTNDSNFININNNPLILINNIPQVTHTDFEIININENQIEFMSGVPNSGKILKVETNIGNGYVPLLNGSATVSVSNSGTISEVLLNSPGSGYRTPPVININSTFGRGAALSATITSSGYIDNIIIDNPGVGYTSTNIPELVIDAPLPYYDLDLEYAIGNTGIGENAKASLFVDDDSTIQNINITETGKKYKVGDKLKVVGLVTDIGAGLNFNEFIITVKEVYSDTFSGIYPGQFLQFDDLSREFNSIKKVFNITTTLNGEKQRLTFKSKNNAKNIEDNFFIFINDIIQTPVESYRYIGGRIVFLEAPKEGSRCNILYYQGSIYDTELVIPTQIFKEGDTLKFENSELSNLDSEQSDRVIKRIIGSNNLDTFPYSGVGISSIVRPISWTKQKDDRIMNGSLISKSRLEQSSKIYPSSRLIWNLTKTDTSIYVDNAYPLFIEFDKRTGGIIEEKRNIKIFKNYTFDDAEITANVSYASTISSLNIINSGSGYNFSPQISISDPPSGVKDPLYNWNSTSGISTSSDFNSIIQGDVIIAVGNDNLVAISTNVTDWNFDTFNYNANIDIQKINVSPQNSYIMVGSNGKIFKKSSKQASWNICEILTDIYSKDQSTYSETFNDIIYNEYLNSWIAIGESGKICVAEGVESDTFIEVVRTQNFNYKAIAYNSKLMIAVGHSGITIKEPNVGWFNVATVPSIQYNDVIWTGTQFVVVSNNGIYTSEDGKDVIGNWVKVNTSPTNLKKISLYDGIYIGIDFNGNIYHSFNLSNWELRDKPTSENVNEINTIVIGPYELQCSVGTAGTIFYSIPVKHKAKLSCNVVNESINSINILDGGFGYSNIQLPNILIGTPITESEDVYTIKAIGDFGKIVGIKTSNTGVGTNTPSISFELKTEYNNSVYNSLEPFGLSINYSNLSVGDYFIITNSNAKTSTGYALTGITTSLGGMSNYPNSRVGTATSYIDGVYKVEKVQNSENNFGISTVTCNVYPVNGGILINTSEINTSYYGNYSWSKIFDYEDRSRRNPLEFNVNTNNGITGLSTASQIHRIPPLIF